MGETQDVGLAVLLIEKEDRNKGDSAEKMTKVIILLVLTPISTRHLYAVLSC